MRFDAMFGIEFAGILALIGFVLWVWAVISIAQSEASPMGKALWIVAVFIFPIVGWIVWFLFGPKAVKRG